MFAGATARMVSGVQRLVDENRRPGDEPEGISRTIEVIKVFALSAIAASLFTQRATWSPVTRHFVIAANSTLYTFVLMGKQKGMIKCFQRNRPATGTHWVGGLTANLILMGSLAFEATQRLGVRSLKGRVATSVGLPALYLLAHIWKAGGPRGTPGMFTNGRSGGFLGAPYS
jgi:hypothetical protein